MSRPAIRAVTGAGLGLVLLAAIPAVAAEPPAFRSAVVTLPAPVVALAADPDGTLTATDTEGGRHRILLGAGGSLIAEPAGRPVGHPSAPRLPAMLPDGEVARGSGAIRAAWLIEPTGRYAHGALGDAVEAGGVAAELADGSTLALRLDTDSVFEDRLARILDADGDGADEILVVRSYAGRGAALALVAPVEGALAVVAESPPIGTPNRWLNPVGAGDFDGDGRVEVAAVLTPHIGGILGLWRRDGARLVAGPRLAGLTNHVIGSRVLGLSAVADVDGDGLPDVVVPAQDRRTLHAVGFRDGRPSVLASFALPGAVDGGVAAVDLDRDGRPDLAAALGARVVVGFALR